MTEIMVSFGRHRHELQLQQPQSPALLPQLRMSRDVPGDGLYLSGLGSFASRTCYANSSGDHLVRVQPSTEQFACCAASPRILPGAPSRTQQLMFRLQFIFSTSWQVGSENASYDQLFMHSS